MHESTHKAQQTPAIIFKLVAFAAIAVLGISSKGDESNDEPTPKELVDTLASRNPRPTTSRRQAEIADSFSWDEQKRVVEAINRLTRQAEEAWPELVRRRDSPEYCLTIYADSRIYNRSVGLICDTIIYQNLVNGYLPHIPRGTFFKLRSPDPIAPDKRGTWLAEQSRKKASLADMQVELAEWAVMRITELEDVDEAEKVISMNRIRSEIERIKASQQPVMIKSIFKTDLFTPIGPDDTVSR